MNAYTPCWYTIKHFQSAWSWYPLSKYSALSAWSAGRYQLKIQHISELCWSVDNNQKSQPVNLSFGLTANAYYVGVYSQALFQLRNSFRKVKKFLFLVRIRRKKSSLCLIRWWTQHVVLRLHVKLGDTIKVIGPKDPSSGYQSKVTPIQQIRSSPEILQQLEIFNGSNDICQIQVAY